VGAGDTLAEGLDVDALTAVLDARRPSPAPRNEVREELDGMLRTLVREGGSDLHLTVGSTPMMRKHGDLQPVPGDYPVLTPDDTAALVRAVLSDDQWERFERDLEIDLAYSLADVSRFRVNCFQQRNSYGSVMRAIPYEMKPLHELGIPPQIERFAYLPRGLVLVTGPHRLGQDDHPGQPARSRQPDPARPHRHDRGPDRVPAPPQAVRGQPARGRRRHQRLRRGAQAGAAPGPGHHPGRRAP
jgi:hypothetical protein